MSVDTKTLSASVVLCICGTGTVATAQTDYARVRDEVDTIRIEANAQRFEPRQSVVAGGFPMHTSSYDVVAVWDPAGERAHEAWDMSLIYPVPGSMQMAFTNNETVGIRTQVGGLLGGADGPMESSRRGKMWDKIRLASHSNIG